MIHSLSGGILADGTEHRFAKVDVGGETRWYLAPFRVAAGDRVLAPVGEGSREGVVIRTELCSAQTAPYPMNRIRALEKLLPKAGR